MSFTDDKFVSINTNNNDILKSDGVGTKDIKVNENNPFAQQDYALVINTFETEVTNISNEEAVVAYHYKDVYSTRKFSERAQRQMDYYPGMHQSSFPPQENPAYTEAQKLANTRLTNWNNAMDSPDAFMGALRGQQKNIDYEGIFGSDADAKERAKNLGKLLTECVPCFGRLLDPGGLLPDGDLLEVHMLNVKIRTDLVEKLLALLRDPGLFIDICELIKLLSKMCPQDLLAMLALLTQYLAKLNLDIKFNINFIVSLVGPILSPFLDALSAWLDKWIQLIIEPMVCVMDNINETIMIARSAKIPFSQASASMDYDIGFAAPGHQNFSAGQDSGASVDKGVWTAGEVQRFETPDKEKYNPTQPVVPEEEIELSLQETKSSWNENAYTEQEDAARQERFQELRKADQERREKVPPPLKQPDTRDGTRWSKDNIPLSEKDAYGFSAAAYPPEKQTNPTTNNYLLDMDPMISSIVQLRNILQASIQYVRDWFTYVTQMIYDLIGTEIGWMTKKTDTSVLKSRLIQLIMLLKSIITTISKNGLECGVNSNLDPGQIKFITEEVLNKSSMTKFEVLPSGEMKIIPPGGITSSRDDSREESDPTTKNINKVDEKTSIKEEQIEDVKQKPSVSGIIIKSCLKDISKEDRERVRRWIADFEEK